jgi:hypothetical protein
MQGTLLLLKKLRDGFRHSLVILGSTSGFNIWSFYKNLISGDHTDLIYLELVV